MNEENELKTVLKLITKRLKGFSNNHYERYLRVLGADGKFHDVLLGDDNSDYIPSKKLVIDQILATGFLMNFDDECGYVDVLTAVKDKGLSKIVDGFSQGSWFASDHEFEFKIREYKPEK